nr:hypothetical protein [Tanacetum cinerariifolium]
MTKALVPRGGACGEESRAGHDGLVGKIGPDDGLVHKQWVEMGLFGAVVGCKGLRVSVTLAEGLTSLVQAWRSPGKGIGVVRVPGL